MKSRAVRIAGAAVVAIVVAYSLDVLVSAQRISFLSITPGQYLAQTLIPHPAPPREYSTLGLKIVMSWIIDTAIWFLTILGAMSLVRRIFANAESR